jgi:hypothetical protein
MQFVPASQLKEGMCVAEHVCDHYGRVLIARGQRIGAFHIERLPKFGIHSLFVDTTSASGVGPLPKSSLRLQCETVVIAASPRVGRAGDVEGAAAAGADATAVRAAADSLVQTLMKSRKSVVTLSGGAEIDDESMRHAVNVAAIAVALGIDFRLPPDVLQEIGSAMLLHDVGVALLPMSCTRRSGAPTREQVRQIKAHTVLGYDYVRKTGALEPGGAELVLSHHERLDGSGYPQGLRRDRLTLPMRIAAVAEAVDSLTSDRFGIPAVLPDAAMAWMLENADTLFDREVVAALNSRIALYPNGSAVRLTTGETGTVAGTLPQASCRPIVLIDTSSRGLPLRHPLIVDLTRETSRAISRCAPTTAILQKLRETRSGAPHIDADLANLG